MSRNDIKSSEITPPDVYYNRRTLLKTGIIAASAVATGFLYRQLNGLPKRRAEAPLPPSLDELATTEPSTVPAASATAAEPLDPATSGRSMSMRRKRPTRASRTTTTSTSSRTDKDGVANASAALSPRAGRCRSTGWSRKPTTFDLDDHPQDQPARGARLSHALRRGVVDGHPVGGVFRCRKLLDRVRAD